MIPTGGAATKGCSKKGLSDNNVVEETILSVEERPLPAQAAVTHEEEKEPWGSLSLTLPSLGEHLLGPLHG